MQPLHQLVPGVIDALRLQGHHLPHTIIREEQREGETSKINHFNVYLAGFGGPVVPADELVDGSIDRGSRNGHQGGSGGGRIARNGLLFVLNQSLATINGDHWGFVVGQG